MIRVLHVLGGLNLGGAETMVMNLYRALDRTKIQFDFIIHLSNKQAYEDEITSLGGKIYRFPSFKGINFYSQKKVWSNFFKEHPEYKVLHSHIRSYATLYIPIAKKHGLKTIIHSHSTSNGKGIASILKTLMQLPLRFQADYLFACSKEAGKWLFGKEALKSSRYYILKNAIDTRKYEIDDAKRKQYREELGIDDNTLVFMHVGRFHEAKNHTFLLDVFAKYHKKHKNSLLVIVGEGDLRVRIENKINELDIIYDVKMLGARSDVPYLLQAADCFLFPSNWEGLPVTVVEAQAAGLPCIVSDTITREVNVSGLVCNLPIGSGEQTWVRQIEITNFSKENVIDNIKNAGFDIKSSAKWLFEFYLELTKHE